MKADGRDDWVDVRKESCNWFSLQVSISFAELMHTFQTVSLSHHRVIISLWGQTLLYNDDFADFKDLRLNHSAKWCIFEYFTALFVTGNGSSHLPPTLCGLCFNETFCAALPPTDVIHTVGPVARGYVGPTVKNDLTSCYQNSLNLVKEYELRSVVSFSSL